ncbi:MAG: hypothetical protein GKS05_10315 [Nitrospirales bacterium]|nr:hypothetical protein [Nitrospirales bacterium]
MHIHLHPHSVFKRQGTNLFVTLPVWPWEAILGTDVELPTLTGTVRLKIPSGSHAHQKLKLKGN